MKDLGINSPDDQRIQFRTTLHCAPLETKGHSRDINTSDANLTAYYYGSVCNGLNDLNATYVKESVQSQYHQHGHDAREQWGKNMITA